MTIFTKLHLIHQLSLIIKYLTSNKIVYHNLNPKNLFVRKGLCVKATDFTNAYHCEINILNYGK
jgi:serine/threonine protein kinase